MIYTAFVIFILFVGLGSAYLVGQRASRLSRWSSTIRAALVIATVRLAILWTGALLWRDVADRQGAAYFLLVLDCLVEMVVVRSWRNDFATWVALLSVLVAATSLGLGYLWALMAEHFRSGTERRL